MSRSREQRRPEQELHRPGFELPVAVAGRAGREVEPAVAVEVGRLRTRRARDTASRGQEKLIAAALTIAQLEIVAKARGQPVVLLLDEPAADLDREHLALLLAVVGQLPFQSFVTALDSSGMKLPEGAREFHVERLGEASFAIITG